MKKRILSLFMVIALCLSFTACSSSTDSDDTDSDTDTETTEAALATDYLQPELLDYGYTTIKVDDTVYIYYAIEFTNQNDGIGILTTELTITSKDADGNVIDEQTDDPGAIAGIDTAKYANCICYDGELPDTIEFSITGDTTTYQWMDSTEYVTYRSDFDISSTNLIEDGDNVTITGNITNNSSSFENSVLPIIILYNEGEMVGGFFNVDSISAIKIGDSTSFEVTHDFFGNIEYDDYEVVIKI